MKIISNLPDTTAPTGPRPDGAFKDVSGPAAGDGTPAREDWLNDIYYALLATMEDGGVSADDSDEEFAAGVGSQFLTALLAITRREGTPIGTMTLFSGPTLPTNYLWVPIKTKTILQATYDTLWQTVYNQIDWFAPDAAAAGVAAGLNEFHMPTIADAYIRAGLFATVTSVDTANEVITIVDRESVAIQSTDLRDGTAVRMYSTANLPGGVTDQWTTLYLHWDAGNTGWSLHTTEADAVSDTSRINLTTVGSGTTTINQLGLSLADASQGHWHNLQGTGGTSGLIGQGGVGTGPSLDSRTMGTGTVAAQAVIETSSGITDGVNGTPRITNETRPFTGYMQFILKVL